MTDPLTALRAVPADAGDLDAARRATHARIDALAAARRHRRRPIIALTTLAGTAAAAVVLTTGGTPVATQPTAATAATVLRDLGQRAGASPTTQLAAGEYYAVRVHQYKAAGGDKGLDTRTWSHDGEGRELILLKGKTRRDVPLGTPMPGVPATADPLPDLRTFPTDPAALAAKLREVATAQLLDPGATPTTRDYMVTAMQMVFDHEQTPPAVLRGIYDFLAGLEGMRLIGDVTDPLGRPGKAVAIDGGPDQEGMGIELILAPDTGLPLAYVHYRDGDVDDPWLYTTRQEGVVTGTDTVPGA